MGTTETSALIESEIVIDEKQHELSNHVQALAVRASSVGALESVQDRHDAEALLHDIKDQYRAGKEISDSFVKPVDRLAKQFRAKFKPALDALQEAERAVKKRIGDFDLAERQKAIEAERAEIAKARAEERKLEAKAKKAEKAGKHELAQDLRNTPVMPMPSSAPAPKVKSSTSSRTKYVAKVTNEDELPRRFMMPNPRALAEYASRYKDSVPPKVPGVLWETKTIVTARR